MGACMKCGSAELLDEAQIIDSGHHGVENDLTARVYRNPGAFFLQGKVTGRVLSRVCGSCGFVELYVENPAAFLAAAKEARGLKRRKR